jgi:15-cis-phytoene synthase
MSDYVAGTFSRVLSVQDRLARAAGSNFYYSFLLLPPAKRKAIKDVYAFCRILDDIVDQGHSRDPYAELQYWRDEIEACYRGVPESLFGERLSDTIDLFELPRQPFIDLIDGMEMDLKWQSYQTFADLREYCYRAASAVGLICIEIFGYESPRTREYAVNLGLALQLTNILRDLKEDVDRGRIYIPIEDMERYGYSEKDLRSHLYNSPFIQLMKFEHARARSYFEKAAASLPEADRAAMFAAEIMSKIYGELLNSIAGVQFDVFRNRVTISKKRKMQIALGTWLKSKFKR